MFVVVFELVELLLYFERSKEPADMQGGHKIASPEVESLHVG